MASLAWAAPVLPVDFAILTALEEEREALLAHLPGARPLEKREGDVATAILAEVPTSRADGAVYRVIVTCLGAMGPIVAATRAAAIAQRWRPQRVLMVGIAGGVSGEAELGDVLVASQIADYTVGKDRGETRSVRWQVYPADPGLLDSAGLLATGWEASIKTRRPGPGAPRRRIGVVASGGDVIARATRIAELRAIWPKLVGVEMEGGGVAAALAEDPARPPFLMIRGVSDLANEAKDAEGTRAFRAYAGDAAAAYAVALMKRGPMPALGRVEDAAAREDRLLERLQRGFSLAELEMFIRRSFPEILGGLSGIVAPVYDFRYQTMQVVDYFKRRRELARLEARLDETLGLPGKDEA